MKRRKTNSSSPTRGLHAAAASSSAASSARSSLRDSGMDGGTATASATDDSMHDEAEELDVMGTPCALAPATVMAMRQPFTPMTPDAASGDESTFRRLNFTTKECATPGRYDARHKLGQPLAVYCRIKPLLAGDLDTEVDAPKPESVMTVESESCINCTAPKDSATFRHGETSSKFTFTRVFGPESSQEEVFTHAAQPLVKAFHEGQNGLIFAYGITASGKTYTMQGTKEKPGLIPRIVADLFGRVLGDVTLGGEAGTPRFKVSCSYLEIYNESINDLLVDVKTKTANKRIGAGAVCKLQTGKTDEVSVVNLREVTITDHREAFSLLNQGQANRTMHETTLNSDSSRSHSVFTLKLIASNGAVWSRLSVVDLAGSERTNRVVHAGKESRMRETVNINQSLLVLGRCLEALKYNQNAPKKLKVVPFRESQITRLFKDSLSGWGRTVMLTNASQNPLDYDETIHALKYAAVAKELRVVPKVDSIRARIHTSGMKRQPSQPLVDLDEIEHAGGGSSSWDADDSNPAYDALLDECFRLKQQIVELELQASAADMNVREELTTQHEELLADLEEKFMDRLDDESKKQEDKFKKLFALWKLESESMKEEASFSAAHPTDVASELLALRRELAAANQQVLDLQSSANSNEVLLESTKEMFKDASTQATALTKKLKQLEKELAHKETELEQGQLLLQEQQQERKLREAQYETELKAALEAQAGTMAEDDQAKTDLMEAQASLQAQLVAAELQQAELQESLAAAQAELKSSAKEAKKERDSELRELKKAHDAELRSLKKSLKEDGKATASKVESQLTQQLEEMKQQYEQAAEELKQQQDKSAEQEASLVATHASVIAANAAKEQQLQSQLAALQSSLDDLKKSSSQASSAESDLQSRLTVLELTHTDALAAKDAQLKEQAKELKDLKKASDAEVKEMKKTKDAEAKELKKAHKEELKSAKIEHDAAVATLKTQLADQIASFEQQLAAASTNGATIASTPASDPLSDTWGQLLSPIKSSAPNEIAAPAAAVVRVKKSSRTTAGVVGSKRVPARSSKTSMQQLTDDSFDPFAFDASMVVAGPAQVAAFMDDDGSDEELHELKKKLSSEDDDAEEYQPTSKKRKTATRSAAGSRKKAAAVTIADKENAPAVANTGRPVRNKRKT